MLLLSAPFVSGSAPSCHQSCATTELTLIWRTASGRITRATASLTSFLPHMIWCVDADSRWSDKDHAIVPILLLAMCLWAHSKVGAGKEGAQGV